MTTPPCDDAFNRRHPPAFYPFMLPPPWFHQWDCPPPPVQIAVNFNVYGGVQHFHSGALNSSSNQKDSDNNKNKDKGNNDNEEVVDINRNASVCTTNTVGKGSDNNKHSKENIRNIDNKDNSRHNAGNDNKRKASTCPTGKQPHEEAKRSKKDCTSYSSTGFLTCLSGVVKETTEGERVLARSRKWSSTSQQWSQ
jgi:hypothetical protein